jgi:transcription elongation GreA/GreB family factor/very-short-patch-repair endonuclease
VYVEDGVALGSNTRLANTAEAEALVDAIVRCCADPAYDGKTMGVISLRASKGHLAELENLLAERLDYEQREERRIRVGDAEDFQGDERHVMFVSCVNSATTVAGSVPGGFNGKTYEQRLNVAASRAQDQVWVFHSARTEQFHENDLRRQWLDHLTRPAEEDTVAVDGEVLADVRHEAFDSLFQQKVYLELTARDYRVRPGYRVGRHSIDLVVEGGTRRLAVACDGDAFAEGEDASTAAARQRDLERVDWTFVRIRGSRFHLDREQALAPLWAELERLGIEPVREEAEEPAPPSQAAQNEASPVGGPAGHDRASTIPEHEATDGNSPQPDTEAAADMSTPSVDPVLQSPGMRSPTPVSARKAAPFAPAPVQRRVRTSEPARVSAPATRPAVPPVTSVPQQREQASLGAPQASVPVQEIPAAAFQRLVREIQELQVAVDAADEAPKGMDAANLVFLRKTQADQRDRRTKRLGFLRAFLDAVRVGHEPGIPRVVIPGALLVLEFDGQVDDDTLYTVAELPTDEADIVSPSSPLGHALMWQPPGREIPYEASGGKTHTIVVREIRV